MTYNIAFDLGRSLSEPSTLLTADANALLNAGVAPDSVARLIALATPLGVPLAATGVPANRTHNTVAWLGRLDDTREPEHARSHHYLGVTRDGARLRSASPRHPRASQRRERTLGAQLHSRAYVGPAGTLNETRIAASGVRTSVSPYQFLPARRLSCDPTTSMQAQT